MAQDDDAPSQPTEAEVAETLAERTFVAGFAEPPMAFIGMAGGAVAIEWLSPLGGFDVPARMRVVLSSEAAQAFLTLAEHLPLPEGKRIEVRPSQPSN